MLIKTSFTAVLAGQNLNRQNTVKVVPEPKRLQADVFETVSESMGTLGGKIARDLHTNLVASAGLESPLGLPRFEQDSLALCYDAVPHLDAEELQAVVSEMGQTAAGWRPTGFQETRAGLCVQFKPIVTEFDQDFGGVFCDGSESDNKGGAIGLPLPLPLPAGRQVRIVLQAEAAVVGNHVPQTLIGTTGANPCVIMAMYNRRGGIAGLTHVDGLLNPLQVIDALTPKMMSVSDLEPLEVHLASGQLHDNNLVLGRIRQALSLTPRMRLISETHTDSLAIDALDGKIYYPLEAHDFTSIPPTEELMRRFEDIKVGRVTDVRFVSRK
jgi:hypothetical protein